MAAAGMAAIANQYAAREAGATKVKVVIMDGGTWDTIQGGAANDVATTFTAFLAKVAADGTVQHIVYFLPPEIPSIPGVAALRPLLMQACAASTVPCHFLDLQTLWSVHPAVHGSESGHSADDRRFSCGRRRTLDRDAAVLHRAVTFA